MNNDNLMKVLLSPMVTEKTSMAQLKGQYVFKVLKDATKHDIKKAVEQLFEVKVESVQVSNVKGKKKMFGRIPGQRKDWKKAYVTLQEGHSINLLGAQA